MLERAYRHVVFFAGLDKVSSDVSCGNDVEDVLALDLEEPVDNPGTTIGTTFFRSAQNYFPMLGQLWYLTTSPLV